MTEEQRRDATQMRDFTTGGKPFGALGPRGKAMQTNPSPAISTAAGNPKGIAQTLFTFLGRVPRSTYLLTNIYLWAFVGAGMLVDFLLSDLGGPRATEFERPGVFFVLFGILSLWPGLALAVKRCHDRNRSGWFALVFLIPVVGQVWFPIETFFVAGTPGPNRFGPDPITPY